MMYGLRHGAGRGRYGPRRLGGLERFGQLDGWPFAVEQLAQVFGRGEFVALAVVVEPVHKQLAAEVIGDDQRSKTDIRRPLALLNDLLYDADSGPLGEALRPMYVDYLLEHEGSEAHDATEGRDDA